MVAKLAFHVEVGDYEIVITSCRCERSRGGQWTETVVRKAVLKIGSRYRVSPINRFKKKHRGRTGVLVDVNDRFMPTSGSFKFDDTGRFGNVDITDLEELDAAS